jgi:hypothetical protein
MQAFQSSPALRISSCLTAASVALVACQPADQGSADNRNAVAEPVVNLPSVARPAASMDREALLLAVGRAASARAAGTEDNAAQRELDGQPFEFTIRFGCDGPAEDLRSDPLGWAFEVDKSILRLRAMPTMTADDPIAARIAGPAVEAIEGFWVPRPWMLHAACPGPVAPALAAAEPRAGSDKADQEAEASPSAPKVGIAQFFTATDARTRRRDGRAYESVKTLEDGARVGSQGFSLVLSGRLRAVPGKRVIECVAADGDTPPDCIVSADIDEVRIEQPADGSALARWST